MGTYTIQESFFYIIYISARLLALFTDSFYIITYLSNIITYIFVKNNRHGTLNEKSMG